MREILFRGIDEGTNKWVYGYYYESQKPSDFGGERRYYIFDSKTISKYNVLPETVGQYTGLTDKNGNKIFEGDIIEGADFTIEDGGYGLVCFEDGAFEVNGNNIIGTFHENYWGREFEVIGNIHDNPELY